MNLETFLYDRLICQYHVTGYDPILGRDWYYEKATYDVYNEILKQLNNMVKPNNRTILRGNPNNLMYKIDEADYTGTLVTPAMYMLLNEMTYDSYMNRYMRILTKDLQIRKMPNLEYAIIFYNYSDLHIYIHGFGNNKFGVRVISDTDLSSIIYYDDMCPFCMHIVRDSMVGNFKLNYPVEIEIQTESEFKLLL